MGFGHWQCSIPFWASGSPTGLLVIECQCRLSQNRVRRGAEAPGVLGGYAPFCSFASAAFRTRTLERRYFSKSRIVTTALLPELARGRVSEQCLC
jgi:hypothetical protein